jgi:hypothetical protein
VCFLINWGPCPAGGANIRVGSGSLMKSVDGQSRREGCGGRAPVKTLGYPLEVNIRGERGMNPQYDPPTDWIWWGNIQQPVEAPRPEQSRINVIRPISCGKYQYTLQGLQNIHTMRLNSHASGRMCLRVGKDDNFLLHFTEVVHAEAW